MVKGPGYTLAAGDDEISVAIKTTIGQYGRHDQHDKQDPRDRPSPNY